MQSALRADARFVDPLGAPGWLSLVLPPTGLRLKFDDVGVQQARRDLLAGAWPRAMTALLRDASHFEGSLVAVSEGDQERLRDDPFARLFEPRLLRVGTGLMMLGGLSAVCLVMGDASFLAQALPSDSVRRLVVGGLFAACVSLVAVSPLGRLSGAHLNPAVTVSFWSLGRVSSHDVGGYLTAQLAGALAGTALVWLLWGATADSVDGGATTIGTGIGVAVSLEVAMTAVLIGVILVFVSDARLASWTPLAIWPVITALVWIGSPFTGTSLNPTRSVAPALVFAQVADLWVYVLAPVVGAAAVGLLWRRRDRAVQPKTAKLFHDPEYPCCFGTDLPAVPAPAAS